MLKKAAKIEKGSSTPSKATCGTVKMAAVKEIAKAKMADLNAFTEQSAVNTILGSARSMGLQVVD
jgi:large subunit ribosomal protein L11